jgi:hypothetical protein
MTFGLTPEGKSMVELATIFAPGGRAASQAAESGAMALGRVGEQYAERKVPEIMAKGGMSAEMLKAMADSLGKPDLPQPTGAQSSGESTTSGPTISSSPVSDSPTAPKRSSGKRSKQAPDS